MSTALAARGVPKDVQSDWSDSAEKADTFSYSEYAVYPGDAIGAR
jgi:hypothetical protein